MMKKEDKDSSVGLTVLSVMIFIVGMLLLAFAALSFLAAPKNQGFYDFMKDHGSLIAGLIALVAAGITIMAQYNLKEKARFDDSKDRLDHNLYMLASYLGSYAASSLRYCQKRFSGAFKDNVNLEFYFDHKAKDHVRVVESISALKILLLRNDFGNNEYIDVYILNISQKVIESIDRYDENQYHDVKNLYLADAESIQRVHDNVMKYMVIDKAP